MQPTINNGNCTENKAKELVLVWFGFDFLPQLTRLKLCEDSKFTLMAVFTLTRKLGRSQYSTVDSQQRAVDLDYLTSFPIQYLLSNAIKCFMDLGLHKNIFLAETLL